MHHLVRLSDDELRRLARRACGQPTCQLCASDERFVLAGHALHESFAAEHVALAGSPAPARDVD